MFSISLQSGRRWFDGSTTIGRSECGKRARTWRTGLIIASWIGRNAPHDSTETVSVAQKNEEKREHSRVKINGFADRLHAEKIENKEHKRWPLVATCNELRNNFPSCNLYSTLTKSTGNWSKLFCLFSVSLSFASQHYLSHMCVAAKCGNGEFSGSFDTNEIVKFMRFKVYALIVFIFPSTRWNIKRWKRPFAVHVLGLDGFGIRNECSHIAVVAMKNSFRFFFPFTSAKLQ